MVGDEVVGVLGQLVLGEGPHQPVERRRRDHEQEEPTEHLQHAVQALERDPERECLVEKVSPPEPGHLTNLRAPGRGVARPRTEYPPCSGWAPGPPWPPSPPCSPCSRA